MTETMKFAVVTAAVLTLLPLLGAAFYGDLLRAQVAKLPLATRIALPGLLCLPYALVACSFGVFHWGWLLLYGVAPIAATALLLQAALTDPAQLGNWRDFLGLGVLGLAVDLRWLEPAWPPHLSAISKILLLDTGIYGFLFVRQLSGVGFDLRLRRRDDGAGDRQPRLPVVRQQQRAVEVDHGGPLGDQERRGHG